MVTVSTVSTTDTKTLLRNAGLEWQEGALETTALVAKAKIKETAEQLQREDWMLLDLVGVDYLEFYRGESQQNVALAVRFTKCCVAWVRSRSLSALKVLL